MERLSDRTVSILPKGTKMTRYLVSLALAKGYHGGAEEIAKAKWPWMSEIGALHKAAVAAGTSSDSAWAAPLVSQNSIASEFVDLLRPQTIVGRLQGLRRVPFNIRLARTTSGSSANWTGQGVPAPVSRMSFDALSNPLPPTKLSTIIVLTDELVKLGTSDSEGVIRRDMTGAIAEFQNQQFINPAVAAVADLHPASITNGVTPRHSTGTSAAQILADTAFVMQAAVNANLTLANGYWIMNPRTALALSQIRETGTGQLFPGISVLGGTFQGLPVIVSGSVPIGTDAKSIIVLVDAAEIYFADEGLVIDISQQASLQMDSAPTTGAANMVSLWQHQLIAFKSDQYIGWGRRREAACQYIDNVAY
jgi:HK97 family phage major capsid protein